MGVEGIIIKDSSEWDSLVDESDFSSIFHKWSWLKTMEKHGAGKLHTFATNNSNAIMPFFIQKKAGLKMLFSPPPQMATPYLGPAFRGYCNLKQSRKERLYLNFHSAYEKYLRQEVKPDYLFISTVPGLKDIRPWQWTDYSTKPLYDYRYDLSIGVDELWNNLKRELRGQIKKAYEAGVEIRVGGKKDFAGLIQDLKKRYVEQGINEQTKESYLKDIFKEMHQKNLHVLVAEKDGERVGGMVELLFKDKVVSWIGGVKSIEKINVNALVQWEGIKKACVSGAKEYIEIGANTKKLVKFKRKFNPEPHLFFNLRKYPNPLLKAVESGYLNIIKPLKTSVRGGGK